MKVITLVFLLFEFIKLVPGYTLKLKKKTHSLIYTNFLRKIKLHYILFLQAEKY